MTWQNTWGFRKVCKPRDVAGQSGVNKVGSANPALKQEFFSQYSLFGFMTEAA